MFHLFVPALSWRSRTAHLLIAGAALVLSMSMVPDKAEAKPGDRICVSENGQYAVKTRKGPAYKNRCNNKNLDESSLSTNINFGRGHYITCEAYASEYLKWEEWNPCYNMNYVHTNTWYHYQPTDDQIYAVAKIPRDKTVKGGAPCGASSCGVSASFGASRSFAYNAGVNITGPAGIFGGNIGFTVTTTDSVNASYSFIWELGLTPGLRFDFVGAPKIEWDYRNIFEIQQEALMASFSKGFSQADRQKEIIADTKYCAPGQTGVQADADPEYWGEDNQTTSTFNIQNQRITVARAGSDTFSTAEFHFNQRISELDSRPRPIFRFLSVQCGVSLKIASDENAWRGASDIVQWTANDEFISANYQ